MYSELQKNTQEYFILINVKYYIKMSDVQREVEYSM